MIYDLFAPLIQANHESLWCFMVPIGKSFDSTTCGKEFY